MTFQDFLRMVSRGQKVEVEIELYGRTFLTRAVAFDFLTNKEEEIAKLRELHVLKVGITAGVLAVKLG